MLPWQHNRPAAARVAARSCVTRSYLNRPHDPSVAGNLRQDNVFARVSWQHERWETALDLLYTPADRGAMATASLAWTGERVKLEAGLRAASGPNGAIVRQLPVQRQGFVMVTWAF